MRPILRGRAFIQAAAPRGIAAMLVFVLALLAWTPARPAHADPPPATHQTLPNGMELLFIEDHSTPLISVCVWVGVGSVDENGRNSGASHLLEHLLFDGTRTRSREAIQGDFDRRGVYVNAFTRQEYTAHILSAPREVIEHAIEIQAEMLLDSTFPEGEIAKERKVVLEEMKRDRDDPRGYSGELFDRELWRNSPLAHPAIGTESAVETVPRDEIISFWRAHYVPDRMIALVTGDFDPQAMRALFERLYGKATPGFAPAGLPAVPPAPAAMARRDREEWVSGNETILRFGFPAPAWDDPDAPAMEIAARLLTGDENGALVRRLSGGDSPPSTEVEGGYELHAGGSAYTVTVTLDSASRAMDVETAVAAGMRALAESGPDAGELERVKTAYRIEDAFQSDNLLYFAMGLADWMPRGGYEERRSFARRAMAVDAGAVRAVVARYLAPMRCLAHLTRPLPTGGATAGTTRGTSTERHVLPNGLVVIGRENPASRITAFHALIEHRSLAEPAGKAGLANFVAEMLAEGTETRSAEEIAGELGAIGAKLQVAEDPRIPFDDYYWSPDYAFVRLEVANEFAPRALRLLDDLLLHPAFPAGRLDATRERILGLLAQEEGSASGIGRLLLRQALFAGTPWANPIRGTIASLAAITRDDLIAFHHAAFAPTNVILSFAGGAPLDSTFEAMESDWRGAARVELTLPPGPRPDEAPVAPSELRRRIERDQMWIGLAHRARGATDPDMPAAVLATAILDRRLGLDLREKQGLAYSVGAGLGLTRDFGWVTLSMGTRSENRDRARAGLEAAIDLMRSKGVTADELELARNATLAQRVRYRQRAIGQAYALALAEYQGLGYEFEQGEVARFKAVTADEVMRAARALFTAQGWVRAEVGRVSP